MQVAVSPPRLACSHGDWAVADKSRGVLRGQQDTGDESLGGATPGNPGLPGPPRHPEVARLRPFGRWTPREHGAEIPHLVCPEHGSVLSVGVFPGPCCKFADSSRREACSFRVVPRKALPLACEKERWAL